MNRFSPATVLCAVLLLALPDPGQAEDKLGKVSFPTSCDPKVQAMFERDVAQLHSFWYWAARQTSRRCSSLTRPAPSRPGASPRS